MFTGEGTSLNSNVKPTINIMKQKDGILAIQENQNLNLTEKSNESLTNERTDLKISNNGLETFSILTGSLS